MAVRILLPWRLTFLADRQLLSNYAQLSILGISGEATTPMMIDVLRPLLCTR